jgi:hypothetical protein
MGDLSLDPLVRFLFYFNRSKETAFTLLFFPALPETISLSKLNLFGDIKVSFEASPEFSLLIPN